MTEELSQKQKRFAREYMVDFDVPAAYVRAGYSEKSARSAGGRLLRDSRMKAYIAELGAEAEEQASLDQSQVIKNLIEDRKDARAAGQFGPAVRADELMGKHFAMFTDVSKNVVVDDMTPEESMRDLCTENGVLNVPAHKVGIELLRLLRVPKWKRDQEPTQPAPTQPALRMVKK